MRSRRPKYGPDAQGNWRITVDPAIMKMKKVGWRTWKPKQVFGTEKIIFIPTSVSID